MCSCTAIRKRRKDDEGRAEIKRGVRKKFGGKTGSDRVSYLQIACTQRIHQEMKEKFRNQLGWTGPCW